MHNNIVHPVINAVRTTIAVALTCSGLRIFESAIL
jgi:hypothetical protein